MFVIELPIVNMTTAQVWCAHNFDTRTSAEKQRSCHLCPPLPQFKDSYESYLRQFSEDGDASGPFGLEYTFTLRETELNKNAVDEVPEWMLPLDALKVGC